MIIWNFKTPLTLIACVVWNCSEYFKIPLGKISSVVFGLVISSNGKQK